MGLNGFLSKNRTYFLLKEPLGSKVATITMIGKSSSTTAATPASRRESTG